MNIFQKKVFILMLIVCASVLFTGCDLSSGGFKAFSIFIGVDQYTGDGSTRFLVPAPLVDGEHYFTDINQTSGIWTSGLVDTPYGKMIEITTNSTKLTNISFHYRDTIIADSAAKNRDQMIERIAKTPLYPASNNTSNQYTIYYPGKRISTYTSYVYIDEDIKPIDSSNQPVKVQVLDTLWSGRDLLYRDTSMYHVVIGEQIPEGVVGFVPITVQVTIPGTNPTERTLD